MEKGLTNRALVLVLSLVVIGGPLANAQADHEHDMSKGMLFVTHDVQPDGYALVGDVSHFGFLLLGKDGLPSRHHNAKVTIVQNAVVLYETVSAHDYDGVNNVEIVFPVPGPYQVIAEVPTSEGLLVSYFNGTAVEATSYLSPSLKLVKAPGSVAVGEPAEFSYYIENAEGEMLDHTDVNVEIRRLRDDQLIFRTHTHTHADPQSFGFVFPETGEFSVRFVAYNAYPTPDSPAFRAFSHEHKVTVDPPNVRSGATGATRTSEAPTEQDDPGHAAAEGPAYDLFATYDPDVTDGVFGPMRLSAVVYDPEMMETLQHVNFEASLVDPTGAVVFKSSSLHEYDGILEILALNKQPGDYRMEVSAKRGTWAGHATFMYRILPPNPAFILAGGALGAPNGSPVSPNSGPVFLETSGTDQLKSGTPQSLEFFAHLLGDLPFQHAEVDFQFFASKGGAPILTHKVHTHADGKFLINVTFPAGGEYYLQADPISIHDDATPAYFGNDVNAPRLLTLNVAQGTPLPSPIGEIAPLTQGDQPARVPGLELPLLSLAAVAVALTRPRRRV